MSPTVLCVVDSCTRGTGVGGISSPCGTVQIHGRTVVKKSIDGRVVGWIRTGETGRGKSLLDNIWV